MENSIGLRIKNKRLFLKMTQEELAQKVGFRHKSSVSKIEKGERDISQSDIIKFAKALQTTPSYIMGWEEDADFSQNRKISEEDLDFLSKFHQLDAKGQLLVNYLIDFELSRVDEIEKLRARTEGNDSHMLAAHHSENLDLTGEQIPKEELNARDLNYLKDE